MIGLANGALKIYVALDPCDMRKSFNGLYDIVCGHLDTPRLSREALFVFTNKRRNRLKILFWDGTGLWVLAKRLEKGRFSWPKGLNMKDGKLTLKHAALSMLMEGIDLKDGMQKAWYER